MPKEPKPRISRFMGTVETACEIKLPDGSTTWLEPESLCYPSGGMLRRCYAVCEDGQKRVFRCGIPDTYFSIPAAGKINGRRVKGIITSGEEGFKFTEYKHDSKR